MPVNGEPSRRSDLRGMAGLLKEMRVDLFEAGLQVRETRQRAARRDDSLGGLRAHVARGHDTPGTVARWNDLLHARDAPQRALDIGARRLDQKRMARAQYLVGEF